MGTGNRASRSFHADVIVAGAGPSGIALAVACAESGLEVLVVAAEPAAAWPNRYGVWLDEAPEALRRHVAVSWASPRVYTSDAPFEVARTYAWLDNDALQHDLLARFAALGGRFVHGMARTVRHTTEGAVVALGPGYELRARVFVDCTGSRSPFTLRERPSGPEAWQTAWGILADVDGWDEPGAVWMDLRDASPGEGGPPTFLYALPLPDGRVFLEETSLVAAPALPMAALEARLAARLAARGIRVRAVHATERCGIPMNAPLPLREQRGLAFGAAGGLVHPASGYSVSTAFQLAPSFAATLAANVDGGPTAAAAAAWDELWPTDRVRARHLHIVGSAALSRMAPAELRAFFTSFFSMPLDVWSRFLASNPGATEVAGTMLHLFRVSPPGVRWSLATRSAAASGPALFSVLGT